MHVIVRVQLGSLMLRNSEMEQMEVVQALGEHTRLTLMFTRDRETDVMLDDLLGAPAIVTLQPESPNDDVPPVQVFTGTVSGGSQSHHMHYGSQFRIQAVSPSIKHEYANTAYFPENTAGDVMRQLGIDVQGSPATSILDIVQFGESDFEFLKRLADENGMFLRTDRDVVEARDKFGDTQHELDWGNTLLSIAASATPTNHGNKGPFYHMEEKRDHRFHGVRQDAPRLGGAAKLVAAANALSSKVRGGGDVLLEDSAFRSKNPTEFRDALVRESVRASGNNVRIEGESILVSMRAGDKVNISATTTFKPPTLGVLGLTEVVHRFDGQTYSNQFVATTWASFSNAVRPPRRLMPGPVTAEVIDNEDPKLMGRLKVRYRWMKLEQETRWLRVVTPYTGNERGVHFTPEIGDEVLVGFEQGDPERAYVLGAVWNGKDLAPQETGMKRIITRSGNTIQMADEPEGRETIEIYSPEGDTWIQLATDSGGKPLLTIHSEGDLSIEAVGQIRMESESFMLRTSGDAFHKIGGKATIDAGGDAIVRSSGNLGLKGGMNATMNGGMNANVAGGAFTNVVGGMVHIQPPGFQPPPIVPIDPGAVPSVWGPRPTPAESKGKSTTDAITPRNG